MQRGFALNVEHLHAKHKIHQGLPFFSLNQLCTIWLIWLPQMIFHPHKHNKLFEINLKLSHAYLEIHPGSWTTHEISCIQGFHHLTSGDYIWLLTIPRNSMILVLSMRHEALHAVHETLQWFAYWNIVFTNIFQGFVVSPLVNLRWHVTFTKIRRVLSLNMTNLYKSIKISTFLSSDIVFKSFAAFYLCDLNWAVISTQNNSALNIIPHSGPSWDIVFTSFASQTISRPLWLHTSLLPLASDQNFS